jgi:membrane-bound lytic murein transglycosylase B
MDRRLFLMSILATAGAAAPDPPTPLGTQPAADLPGLGPPTEDPKFDAWKQDFIRRALAAEWPADLIERELKDVRPEPRVLIQDVGQPEFSKPFGDYIRTAVSETRIETGRRYREELTWLPALETRFGVPKEILIAIWAMETNFGAIQGDFDVVQATATLAANGRRRDWAEAQLFAALRILATMPITRAQLKGSWAGAMGQTQFIPETYLATAIDADGDGKRDIWGSSQDALASAANLLRKEGWRPGIGWHREVILPTGFDYGLAEGPRRPFSYWTGLGVRTADRQPMAEADAAAESGLILPQGWQGPAFLVLPNHFVIRRYNNSTAYALAVGLLADRYAGAGPLTVDWPPEGGLSIADRTGAQLALARLGFNPGAADGVIGTNTRASLRQWQKARGIPADGHLTPELAQRLIAEAQPH